MRTRSVQQNHVIRQPEKERDQHWEEECSRLGSACARQEAIQRLHA